MWNIVLPLAALLFLFGSLPASAGEEESDLNGRFWSEWRELKESYKWKSLEKTTAIIRKERGAESSSSDSSSSNIAAPRNPIIDASINDVSEAAQFLVDVNANVIKGAEGAISTVVNMRTRPDIRAKSQELVPPERKQDVREMVERIPPGRYFTDIWSTQHSTSAFLPNPSLPAGAVESSSPDSGGGDWASSYSGSAVAPRLSAPPGYTPPANPGAAGCIAR